jgi:D-sedoheptulose 7-phosphate isomerase
MTFTQTLNDHLECFQDLADISEAIISAGKQCTTTLRSGGKLLICGNGGSAADSQHFAAEVVGRFAKERSAWPAIALNTDTSVITAVANDYSFNDIFARQVEGIGCTGDLLIGISTSGNSENVVRAARKAHEKNIEVIALLGEKSGKLSALADLTIHAPSTNTPRIQEIHAFILHFWAEMIENTLCAGKDLP